MSKANFTLRKILADLFKVYDIYDVIAIYNKDFEPNMRRLQYQLKDVSSVIKDMIEEDSDVL